jgi:ketosteroid isomerase-like protein
MHAFTKAGLGLALILAAAAASAVGDDRTDLARLLETFLAGASVNDAAVHERFWAEDLVYTSSDGRRFGKADILAGLAESDPEEAEATPEYSARDIGIRVFGDTAVVTFRLQARQGGELVGEYLNTGVFRRLGPGWQAVTWQATRAAASPDAPASGDEG